MMLGGRVIRLSARRSLRALNDPMERVVFIHCDTAQGTRTSGIQQDFFERPGLRVLLSQFARALSLSEPDRIGRPVRSAAEAVSQ